MMKLIALIDVRKLETANATRLDHIMMSLEFANLRAPVVGECVAGTSIAPVTWTATGYPLRALQKYMDETEAAYVLVRG